MVFSTLQQSFAFHASPETFINTRIRAFLTSQPNISSSSSSSLTPSSLSPSCASSTSALAEQQRSRPATKADTDHYHGQPIVTATILNRHVHIVSSYALCRAILESSGGGEEPSSSSSPPIAEPSSSSNQLISASVRASRPGEVKKDQSHDHDHEHHQEGLLPLPLRTDSFTVGPAYRELMTDFFPAPNVLLEDGAAHAAHKARWRAQVADLPAEMAGRIRHIARTFVSATFSPPRQVVPATATITTAEDGQGGEDVRLDLYEALKSLSWELLLGVFLGLGRTGEGAEGQRETKMEGIGGKGGKDEKAMAEIELEQETLLRGQFSLFPVAVNTRLWQSPRTRGLKARERLQGLIRERVQRQRRGKCPGLTARTHVGLEDVASHCLLFTSSIANKAVASLMTAVVLNLFLMPGEISLATLLRSQSGDNRSALLRSIILETERLSPPEIGVMRRVQHDVLLRSSPGGATHLVPAGHDVWLYLAGASRDSAAFDDAEKFHFDRFAQKHDQGHVFGFAFGSGPKACLGQEVVRQMVTTVAEELIDSGLELEGSIAEAGVRGWLGWEAANPAAAAKDLKQLPSQRPRNPIMVAARQT